MDLNLAPESNSKECLCLYSLLECNGTLNPEIFGLFDDNGKMIGYINCLKSAAHDHRKVLGIASIQSCMGFGIGKATFRYFQENLGTIFPGVTELVFTIKISSQAMIVIGRTLGFELIRPESATRWGEIPEDTLIFSWTR